MSQPQHVMRSFTRAFKIPVLIGRLSGGFSLPGGPYTLAQIVTALCVFAVCAFTREMWGKWGLLDFVAAALVGLAVGLVAGKFSFGTRGPIANLVSLLGGMSSPSFGSYHGHALTLPRRPSTWATSPLRPGGAGRTVLILDDSLSQRQTSVPPRPRPTERPQQRAHPLVEQPSRASTALVTAASAQAPEPTHAVPAHAVPAHTVAARTVRALEVPACGQRPVTAIDRLLAAAERVS